MTEALYFFISLELVINLSNCSFVNKYLKVQIKRQGLKWKKLAVVEKIKVIKLPSGKKYI